MRTRLPSNASADAYACRYVGHLCASGINHQPAADGKTREKRRLRGTGQASPLPDVCEGVPGEEGGFGGRGLDSGRGLSGGAVDCDVNSGVGSDP